MMFPDGGKNTSTCYNVWQKVFYVWLSIIKNYEADYPNFRPELQSNHQLSDCGQLFGYHFQDKYTSFGYPLTAI